MIVLLSPERVIEIHDHILKQTNGLPGLAGHKSLESALARIQHHLDYEQISEHFEIAAMYVIALAQGHVFNDANKRTSLLAIIAFLETNGHEFTASETDAENIVVDVVKKVINHSTLAEWIRANSKIKSQPD